MFLPRRIELAVEALLDERPAVALLGPRQVGKTTLAMQIARKRESVNFDLENPEDLFVLEDAAAILPRHRDKLVIIDEVQRMRGLFLVVRGLIDAYRREGLGTASTRPHEGDPGALLIRNLGGPTQEFLMVMRCPGGRRPAWAVGQKAFRCGKRGFRGDRGL